MVYFIVGLFGARVNCIEGGDIHALSPVGAGHWTEFIHGLHRSTDGGDTWERLTNGIPADAWVTSLSLAAGPPEVLYAGTWDGQVYRSLDGGDSWEGLGYLGHVYAVLAHPEAPSVVYAGTSNNGLFRGSTLDHLTMEPVVDPQYVHRPFTVTLTARDTLGFPLTGNATLAQTTRDRHLAATLSAGGYAGSAVLAATTDVFSPQSVTLVDGVGTTQVTFTETGRDVVLTATLPEGPSASSAPFDVVWYARVYLPLSLSAGDSARPHRSEVPIDAFKYDPCIIQVFQSSIP